MKKYILTDNGCIINTETTDCRIYTEEDGTMIEWKDKVYNKDCSIIQGAVVKDKIIKESDKMVRLIVYREFYLNKKEAEEIAMKVADEECYSDLIDCTTQEDYEKFIEKWENQVGEE